MELRYAVFALLLVSMVSAQGPFFEVRGDGLDAALDNAVCKSEYMNGLLGSVMEHVEGMEGLQAHVDTLDADISELESLADADDFRGFVTYVRSDYEPHLIEARADILEIRGSNLPPATKAALLSDFLSLSKAYESCNSESAARYANAKLAAYEQALELAEDQIDDLSGKGIETSGLSSLVREARDEIVSPLKGELDDADSALEIRAALAKYCLFDGCPRGTNFHFASKFGHEKLQQILYYVDDRAEAAGLGDKVDEAQSDLDEAKEILDDTGSGNFEVGKAREFWNALADATMTLREIVSKLRAGL